MTDADAQISWMTLRRGTDVYGSDETKVGEVGDVIADDQKGIFSGITLSGGLFGTPRFVAADLIDRMTAERVHLSIPSADAENLEEYES